MPARQDLTGQQFGTLKVLKLDVEKTSLTRRGHWICSCEECGEEHSIRTDTLKKIQHCPINAHRGVNIKNEVGNVYGKLKVIGQDTTRINNNQNAFWFCECECGTVCSVNGIDLRRGHTESCGCVHSRGEAKIIDILKNNDIIYIKEKVFNDCIFPESNGRMRFDFYLPDYNIIIEYNGEQHYQSNESGWNTMEALKKTQDRDNYKKQWCKDNNITMIIIPYTDYDIFTINSLLGKEDKYIYAQ